MDTPAPTQVAGGFDAARVCADEVGVFEEVAVVAGQEPILVREAEPTHDVADDAQRIERRPACHPRHGRGGFDRRSPLSRATDLCDEPPVRSIRAP